MSSNGTSRAQKTKGRRCDVDEAPPHGAACVLVYEQNKRGRVDKTYLHIEIGVCAMSGHFCFVKKQPTTPDTMLHQWNVPSPQLRSDRYNRVKERRRQRGQRGHDKNEKRECRCLVINNEENYWLFGISQQILVFDICYCNLYTDCGSTAPR